jgi:hypothetical protein
MVRAGVIVAATVMYSARRVRIAQNDVKSPVDRRQHEPGGHQRTKAEHGEHQRCSPMACAPVPQSARSSSHHGTKMLQCPDRIK